MSDVPAIHRLITHHAERGRMLFRSHGELYEHLRDFLVAAEEDEIVGCCAVELIWHDLAEIKSLAVEESRRGGGVGKRLVAAATKEGRRLGLARLFALTREVPFFERAGFHVVPRESLPHKVWTDCIKCPVQDCCDETAVVLPLTTDGSPTATAPR